MCKEFYLIISFASSKGGVGKSTCCAAIAAELAQDGDRVLVLDLDQNQTVARWGRKAKSDRLTVLAVPPDAFTRTFRDLKGGKDYDHVLIDLAGTREATLLKAMARSDLVIIPAQASEPDLREALVIVDDIRDVIEAGADHLKYRLLLTKLFPLPTRVTIFAHREIERHELDCFKTGLVERAQYREMFLTGLAPSEAQPKGKAAKEIAALVDEIKTIVAAGKHGQGRGGMSEHVPEFKPVEIDELDRKLNATASRKRIPTLTVDELTKPEEGEERSAAKSKPKKAPKLSPRKPLNLEVPDYLATTLKVTAAQQSVTVRHLVLSALVDAGYDIKAVDMEEDGRRLR